MWQQTLQGHHNSEMVQQKLWEHCITTLTPAWEFCHLQLAPPSPFPAGPPPGILGPMTKKSNWGPVCSCCHHKSRTSLSRQKLYITLVKGLQLWFVPASLHACVHRHHHCWPVPSQKPPCTWQSNLHPPCISPRERNPHTLPGMMLTGMSLTQSYTFFLQWDREEYSYWETGVLLLTSVVKSGNRALSWDNDLYEYFAKRFRFNMLMKCRLTLVCS